MKIKHILLFLMAWVSSMSLAYAQQTVVASGSVMDEKGELLIGVSISVKEVPSMGAITDIDGRFKIGGIKAGHTLVISYVGYDPQEIKMNKSNERMRVVLKESSNVMDEVVITASGKVQKKINVTGAITGVEVATLKTPATSISNMLGGRVPGIISVTRSGEPGKDFSEFWVRGISTFGAGQGALVLIDGVEGNLNTLDPEDIESFSILKDASSTAVYGVRGANGVVLVSTKKGKAGKLNLQVKANAGISYSPRMPKYVRAAEYAALANEAAVTRGRIPVYSDVDVDLFRNHMDPDFHPDVDWRDVILRDYTWNQQYFLSASGGGEVARYYISAGFTTKDAIFKQDKGVNKYNTNVNYNKFNFRANVDVNVTSTTTLSLNEETVIVTQNYPGYGNDSKVLWQAQSNLTPVTVPLMYTTGQAPGYGTDKSNISPYVLLNMTGYRKFYSNDNKITMQLNQDLKMITPGLSIAGLVNINSIGARTQVREKMPAIYYAHGYKRDGTLDLEKISDAVEPYYTNWNDTERRIYWDFRLNYDQTFNVDDIKDVFYSPATSVGPLYGSAAGNGAIVVTTKNGFIQKNKMNSNIQTITTLGYQQTVEFYSPAYDTEAKKESVKPDLRSTIYWNPSVQVDESGTVHVSFYTADSAADYGVVIEGVCTSGNLIYSGEKVISRHSDSY